MLSRRFAALAGAGALGAAAVSLAGPAAAQSAPDNESTFNRTRRTLKLRIAGIVGTEP